MKNKNGFTLVELLAVLVILAIVLIIAVPGVLSIINSTKNNAYKSQLEMIKDASKNYIVAERSNVKWVKEEGNQYTYVLLEQLQKSGYLDKKIIDPRTKALMDHYFVRVDKPDTGSIRYQVLDSKDINSTVQEGLIVHYDGIMNDKTSHGASTVWKDLSSFGVDSTLYKFTDLATSWGKDHLTFNGVDQQVYTSKKLQFGGSGAMTVQFFISDYALPAPTKDIAYPIVETSPNYNSYNGSFFLHYGNEFSKNYDSNNHFAFAIRKPGGYLARFATTTSTDVHSVIVVVDTSINDVDGQMKVYFDGQLTELSSLAEYHNTITYQPFLDEVLAVGNRIGYPSTNPLFWKGKFHNLKIYNRALSESEVQANYFIDQSRLLKELD